MNGASRIFPLTAVRRLPWASLLLAAAAVVVHLLPSASTQLQYDRLAIAAGEFWRILSGHWTHVSGNHLLWDVLTFLVLGMLCEQASRARFYACLAGSAVLIPVVLWITLPHLATYRGLSGIDSALFALLAVTLLKDQVQARRWSWVTALSAVFLAFIAKVGYEVATGGTLFVDSTAAHMLPVPLAHCVGFAVGTAVGLTGCRKRRLDFAKPCLRTGDCCVFALEGLAFPQNLRGRMDSRYGVRSVAGVVLNEQHPPTQLVALPRVEVGGQEFRGRAFWSEVLRILCLPNRCVDRTSRQRPSGSYLACERKSCFPIRIIRGFLRLAIGDAEYCR